MKRKLIIRTTRAEERINSIEFSLDRLRGASDALGQGKWCSGHVKRIKSIIKDLKDDRKRMEKIADKGIIKFDSPNSPGGHDKFEDEK